jgi:uncharacterized protein with FMN-binding domain
MKKIWGWIVGVVIVAAIGAYIIFGGSNSGSGGTAPSATNSGSDTAGTGAATSTASGGGNSGTAIGVGVGVNASGTMPDMTMGQYKNGTYTGSVADAIYGKLQVVATVSDGMITNITWPVYPNDGGHTSQVSASALPQLEQEAIASQDANVNIVSGATQTSEAFQQSLAAALAQAKS